MDILQAFEIVLPLMCPVMTQSEREHWRNILNETELRNPDGAQWLRNIMETIWSETDAHNKRNEIAIERSAGNGGKH